LIHLGLFRWALLTHPAFFCRALVTYLGGDLGRRSLMCLCLEGCAHEGYSNVFASRLCGLSHTSGSGFKGSFHVSGTYILANSLGVFVSRGVSLCMSFYAYLGLICRALFTYLGLFCNRPKSRNRTPNATNLSFAGLLVFLKY